MKRLLAVLALLGMLGGAILYNMRARSGPSISSAAGAAFAGGQGSEVPVTVSTVGRHAMRQSLMLVGILRADRQASIAAKVPGRIAALLVREGQHVRRGEPLMRLDVRDAQVQVVGAQAGVQAALAQMRKAVDAREARAIEMEAQVAQAEGGLKTALAKRRQAELALQLSDTSIASDAERARAAVRQAEAGVRQAEAGLTQATETLKRTRFLYSKGGVAKADLEGAEAQAGIATAQRDSAVSALEQARAAAPAAADAPLRRQVSEADLDAARAGVRQAESGVRSAYRARVGALRLAGRDIDAARAQVEQARAGKTQATVQVGSGTLTSPLDGIVTDLAAHAGETAQPGQPLMNVVSPGSVYMEVAAPARYAGGLKPGQPARVTVDTLPNRPLDGEVMEVLPVASADGRSLPVRIRMDSEGLRLTPGVAAKAEVDLARDAHALTVAVDALRNEGSATFVYVVERGKAQRRNLTLGAVEGQYAQALSGLKQGDVVILAGPASLQSGTPVRIVGR